MEFQQGYNNFNLEDKVEVDGGSIDTNGTIESEGNKVIQEEGDQEIADKGRVGFKEVSWQEEEDVASKSRPKRSIRRPSKILASSFYNWKPVVSRQLVVTKNKKLLLVLT